MPFDIAKHTARRKTNKSSGLRGGIARDVGTSPGVIESASIITRGEALGHDIWIDDAFVVDTVSHVNAAGDQGVRCRFTHPDLSSDGLGKFLGRVKSAKMDIDTRQALADIVLSPVARRAPDGDLAAYVLALAEDDPEAFGTSIVFDHDPIAEREFFERHGGVVVDMPDGQLWEFANFESPDPENVKNLRHARILKLKAVDVVDSPAANPNGMFARDPVFADLESILAYSLGLSNQPPKLSALDLDADKVSNYVSRFLNRHDLEIFPKGKQMDDNNTPDDQVDDLNNDATPTDDATPDDQVVDDATPTDDVDATPTDPVAEPATLAELRAACDGADADFILSQLDKGASLADAQKTYIGELSSKNTVLSAKLKNADDTTDPAAFDAGDGQPKKGRQHRDERLASILRFSGASRN